MVRRIHVKTDDESRMKRKGMREKDGGYTREKTGAKGTGEADGKQPPGKDPREKGAHQKAAKEREGGADPLGCTGRGVPGGHWNAVSGREFFRRSGGTEREQC